MVSVTEGVTGATESGTETDVELAARLRLAVMRLARRLRAEAQGEITASQLSALSSLDRKGPLTLGELSAVERVKPPTLTRVVACLEELGLVSRTVDPADRRVSRVEVTARGRRFLERARTRSDAYLAARLEGVPAEERAALAAAADVLERLLERPG